MADRYEVHELMVCRIAMEMTEEGDYVTILGSGPEMQPSCCVSTSKVICRYRVCRR